MPRGLTSSADLGLLADLAARGCSASPFQLERWRAAGMLPKPERKALGRGCGSTSRYPDEAVPMAVVLARQTGQGRSLHAAALDLFMQCYPVPQATLREAMAWAITRTERKAKRIREAGEDAISRTLRRAERQIGTNHPLLAAYNVGQGLPPQDRRERRKGLKESVASTVAGVLYDDVPAANLIAEELEASGLPETAEIVRRRLIQAELDGEVGLETGAFEGMRERIASVPFERLCAARFVGSAWLLTFALLWAAARFGDPDAVFMLQHLESLEPARYVMGSMSFFSNPQEVTTGLLGLATNDLLFSTTWDLCRPTLSRAAAACDRAAQRVCSTPRYESAFAYIAAAHSESWPDEVPETSPLTIEELWTMAGDPERTGLGRGGLVRDYRLHEGSLPAQ